MKITYIHHSCFLVETDSCYYLFDYEKGTLPQLNVAKPILVFSSHGHHDHYNPEIFSVLADVGMQQMYAVLSDDIPVPSDVNVLQVFPGREYKLWQMQKLTTYASTDLGVAFLVEDQGEILYHSGDLNDWVWEGEPESYNEKMTLDYRRQIDLLAATLGDRRIHTAFVVLDPRQETDYDRGICYFLEHIPVTRVYPMHYWGKPEIINIFLREHPEYQIQIKNTEAYTQCYTQERGTL